MEKKKTAKYLAFTFGAAWALQIGVMLLYQNGKAAAGRNMMALMMFVPMLGVLVSGTSLKGMGWKPKIRGNIRNLLAAWFLPAVFTAAGAVLFFAVFPGLLDMSGSFLVEAGGEEALRQMEAQGITYPLYVLISVISCLTYAPILNMFLAAGEEAGWRGFLYPRLKAAFGKTKGRILGGIIWGSWHWPLIWLIGYEYGTGYIGFPVTGMLLFCVSTVAMGILCDWLYEKSGSIWFPSIFHGAFNAAATIPMAVCRPDTGSLALLGPAPIGLLAGLPLLLFALGLQYFDKSAAD